MARPREFDEQAVLKAVMDVFWRKGYEGASYTDLVAASGLHKGSLYAAFGDKRALYLCALEAYIDCEVGAAEALLSGQSEDKEKTGRERIEALLNSVIAAVAVSNDRRGCFLCNAAVDQAPHDKGIEELVAKGFLRMQKAFEKALSDKNQTSALKATASLVNATYFGMRVMAKSGAPLSLMKQARNGVVTTL